MESGTSRDHAIDDGSPTAPVRRDYAPAGTGAKPGIFGLLKRLITEFSEDNLSDWAAALTYYGLLALFPALIALVAIVGLVANPTQAAHTITKIVTQIGPSSGAQTFKGPIHSITSNQQAAGILLVVGLAGALWSASGYVGAFIRASNVIYETPEGRPIWKLRPLQMLVTLAIVVTIFAVLYYSTPNVKLRGFRWVTPGSVFAVIVWLIASALFALYVANFGSYDKTYGTLGGVVVTLVWMWITNVAILLGQELNAERERGAELSEGVPRAEREIQLEPRGEPKEQRTT